MEGLSDPRFRADSHHGGGNGAIVELLAGRFAGAAAMFRVTPSGDDIGFMELFAARSLFW